MQTLQPDIFSIYQSSAQTALATLKAVLRNMEPVTEQQRHWIRVALEQSDRLSTELAQARTLGDLVLAQSQFGSSQVIQAVELWWRILRGLQEAQRALLSGVATDVRHSTQTARASFDWAMRLIEASAGVSSNLPLQTETQQSAWTGPERRTATISSFPGPERRKAL